MTEEQIKHLEFIQDVITRMNSNSFQIKGWCITILSALCAIYCDHPKRRFYRYSITPNHPLLVYGCILPTAGT